MGGFSNLDIILVFRHVTCVYGSNGIKNGWRMLYQNIYVYLYANVKV